MRKQARYRLRFTGQNQRYSTENFGMQSLTLIHILASANESVRTLNHARLTSSKTCNQCPQSALSILLVIVVSAKAAFATEPIAGSVVLWGQLRLQAGMTVTNMAAGGSHRLVLWQDGTVSGWGNSFDQSLAPAGISNIIAVAAGAYHSLTLKADGTV